MSFAAAVLLAASAHAAAPSPKAQRLLKAAIQLTHRLELTLAAQRFDDALAEAPGWKTAAGHRAACRWTMGDAAGATEDARLAAGLRPNDAVSRAARGKARRVLRDFDGALADFRALGQAEPGSAEGPIGEGETLSAAGRSEEALKALDEAVRRDPFSAAALLLRAAVKDRLRDFRGSADDYGTVLEVNPRFSWAHLYRGKARRELKDYRGAEADLSRFLESNDEHEDGHYVRSNLRFLLGDHRGAAADLTRVIALNPRKGLAYSNRGQVRARLGDKAGALADLRKALELDPTRRDKIQAAIDALETPEEPAEAAAPAPRAAERPAPRSGRSLGDDELGAFSLEEEGEARPPRKEPAPDLDELTETKAVRGKPGPGEKRAPRNDEPEQHRGAEESLFIDR